MIRIHRSAVAALAALALIGLLAGCGSGRGDRRAADPSPTGPDCLAGVARPSPDSSGERHGATPLPALTLACLVGGRQVRLAELPGPAVVNLWASWCAPCRAELPAIQRYAERAAGRLLVVGVASRDRGADAALSVVGSLGLTFPMLVDPDGALLAALGRTTLPVTLLVAADGRIAYTYVGTALDGPALAGLVERHLGVVVPG